MKPGQNSVERIRRHEVFRALEKVDLSPEEEEDIDRSDEERRGESQTLRRSLGELPKGEGGTLEKAPEWRSTRTGFAHSIRRLEISTERTTRHVKEDSLCRACRTERR